MWLFRRHKVRQQEIEAVKEATLKTITDSTQTTQRLNRLMAERKTDVALNIFMATGGQRRVK